MTKEYLWTVFIRFLRAFIGGGLGQIVLTLATTPFALATWTDLKRWAIILIAAFVTGGVLALDKLLRFDPGKA